MFPFATWRSVKLCFYARNGAWGMPSENRRHDSVHGCHDILENVPVPILRTLRSSNVGSQTKSSHIWQYNDPLLESTSSTFVRQQEYDNILA